MVSPNFFTPGPQTYNVTPESPVAPVTPAIGGIARSVGGLLEGSINAAVRLEQAANRGAGSGPKKEHVAAWSEGIQRIAQLPEAQRPMAYKNFVGNFATSTGTNVGHAAFKSITDTFLGESPQYTLEERIDTAARDAMVKDPEFLNIFNVAKAQNQGKSTEEIVDIASTQYESVNAAKQSIATGEALSGATWELKGEPIATGRMRDLRNYATYSAYDVLQERGLKGALDALDAHIARVQGEKNSIYAMAVQGGVKEEQLTQFNNVAKNTIDELTALKTLLTNDNTASAVQKLISDAAGDQVAQAENIGQLISIGAMLDMKVLANANFAPHIVRGIGELSKKGFKFKEETGPDGQKVFTFLGSNATSEGILAAASIVGERAYAPGEAISRSLGAEDLGFQAQRRRIAQAEAQQDAVPPLPPVRPDGVGIDPADSVSLEDAARSQSPEAKSLAERYSRVSSDTVKEMQEWTQLMISAPTGPMTESQANLMADSVISLSLAAQGEGKRLPYSEGFINKLWNNPNFLANMENLKTFDPQKYETVKKFVNGHLQYEANVNQQRMRVAAEKISERSSWVKLDPETNRLIVDPEMYSVDARGVVIPRTDTYTNIGRREKVEFLSALMENYGGNITAAALDNYSKLRFTVDGRTREVNLRALGLPDARDVKEFVNRQGSYRSVSQAEYNLNKDKLDMVGVSREQYINERQAYATGTFGNLGSFVRSFREQGRRYREEGLLGMGGLPSTSEAEPVQEPVMNQGAPVSPASEDRSVLQRVGDAVLGSPAAAAELSPQPSGNIESKIKEEIRSAEGFRGEAYVPTKGDVLTIGFGFTEGVKPGDTMTRAQAEERLTEEVNSRLTNIRSEITDFDRFPEDAQVAMFSSWYRGSLSGSPKTISLINEGKYDLAADEFLNNDEYKNAVSRGRRGIRARMEKTADAIRSLMPEGMSDEDFVSEISKTLAETPTERRVREAQARQAAKEAYYRSLNQ